MYLSIFNISRITHVAWM